MKSGWNFDNSYARLPELFYSKTNPFKVSNPELIILNLDLAKNLGLNSEELQTNENIAVFSGNQLPKGSSPIAQAYAGHQFGHFTMLGDGRAVLLGEQITTDGDRFDIQLKGSGRTPYSRGGDGRATLGPMLREYIMSEAMHELGIPTTRSLAVVTTGEPVYRESPLPGAVLTRVAASHIRVGTFEYVSQWGTKEDLQRLADYAINRHYPKIDESNDKYFHFLKEVIKRQAKLIAKWQLVGFVHGVMNTDNMTISGETIDYGPCAFMDTYNPNTVFSSIDQRGRYAYGNQPYIGGWNLSRFAETLIPLLHDQEAEAVKLAQEAISTYGETYHHHWIEGMRAKLGLVNEEEQDETLIDELLNLMEEHKADYTNTFRLLTVDHFSGLDLFETEAFKLWYNKWQERLEKQGESKEFIQQLMRKHNPSVIPRNHRVEEALDHAVKDGDYTTLDKLLDVLSCPYGYNPEHEEYTTLPKADIPFVTYCGT